MSLFSCVSTSSKQQNMSWISLELREHPLVGTWWDVQKQQQVQESDVIERVQSSEFILLGEKHDNPDHHKIQAQILAKIQEGNSSPILISFEMLNDKTVLEAANWLSTADFAKAVKWEESGWPDFSMYEPIFSVALEYKNTIVAGSPTPKEMMSVAKGTMDSEVLETLGVLETWSVDREQDLEQEIIDSHCGYASEDMVEMMMRAQRYKDAMMAKSLRDQTSDYDKKILIAGGGHTRLDRGVAWYLDAEQKQKTISILPVEVQDGIFDMTEYPKYADFIFFTPRVDQDDPCETYRKQLEQMKQH